MPAASPSKPPTGLLVPPQELDRAWHRVAIAFAGALGSLLFSTFFQWRVTGTENVPRTGPLMVTINHVSAMDVLTLGTALINLGFQPGVNMFTISKHELLEKPVLPWLMGLIGMFPLHRNQMDLNAMRTMLAIFKGGGVLGIAPEGTRSPTGELQLFQPVVAKLAIQKRIPILPVGLVGMEKVLPIGARMPRPVPIGIHFGKVYELASYYGRELSEQDVEAAAWEMRSRVAELLPEWMRILPAADSEVRFGSVLSAQEQAA